MMTRISYKSGSLYTYLDRYSYIYTIDKEEIKAITFIQ